MKGHFLVLQEASKVDSRRARPDEAGQAGRDPAGTKASVTVDMDVGVPVESPFRDIMAVLGQTRLD